MEQITQLSNGDILLNRHNNQPLMHLVFTVDCLVGWGTCFGSYPLTPLIGDFEQDPYKIVPNLMNKAFEKKVNKAKSMRAKVKMKVGECMLLDHRYNLCFEEAKTMQFINKYQHIKHKLINDETYRLRFLSKHKISVASSKVVCNYIDNDELYDSDQEYIQTHSKLPAGYGTNVGQSIALSNPKEQIHDIIHGKNNAKTEKKDAQQQLERNHATMDIWNTRNKTYLIQNMIQSCTHFIFTIYLTGIYPRIYRKIRVPSRLSLRVFHAKVLSIIFGYKQNFHSYLFLKPHRKNKRIAYGPWEVSSLDNIHKIPIKEICVDDEHVYLFDVFKTKGDKLRYIYDLGDQYHHTIILDHIIELNTPFLKQIHNIPSHHTLPTKLRWKYEQKPLIELINGKRNGAPENMRGNIGYIRRLNILQNGKDIALQRDRHKFEPNDLDLLKTMMDIKYSPNIKHKQFDSEKFDIKECQKNVKNIFSKPILKNDLRYFVHPTPNNQSNNVKQYENSLKRIRSKEMMGVRGIRVCEWMKCRTEKYKMKYCGACKCVFYCSVLCQKKDWKLGGHSYVCFDSNHIW